MLRVAEMALQLLLRPVGMTESFRRTPPVFESALIFLLIVLAVLAYVTGLLGAELHHAFFSSFVTVSGALLGIAGFVVVTFLLHVNALIFGGRGRYIALFAVLLILLCSLFVFVRLPLTALVSLIPLSPVVVKANAALNALLLVAFLLYALVAVRSLYGMPMGDALLAFCLLLLYAATIAASFKVGLRWFAAP